MADYSLRGYLEGQSTKELKTLLEYCLLEENYAMYQYAVLAMLQVLIDRYVPEDTAKLMHRSMTMLIEEGAKANSVKRAQ